MSTDHGIYAKLPGFTEPDMRVAFHQAIPLKTLVIYCPDPRAGAIPAAVAREFDQVWPGEPIRNEAGAKVGFTNNIGQIITVGGRAIDALRSVTVLNHMLGVENVVIVHHTFCGTTAFTPEGLFEAYSTEQGGDIRHLHRPADLVIADFEQSLRHDVAVIRNAPGTPKHIHVFGYIYDIDAETLTKVVEDRGAAAG